MRRDSMNLLRWENSCRSAPLRLFNEVQEPLLLEKLANLEQAAQRAKLINSQIFARKTG
jgi:hypothetical protein